MQMPLMALPISIVFALITTAFGRRMLRLLHIKTESPLESNVFGIGLGLGVLAYLVLMIGLAQWLNPLSILIVTALMAIFAFPDLRDLLKEVVGGLRSTVGSKLKAADALITLSTVALGGVALVAALAPPSGLEWDSLAYHLAVPKLYLQHHGIYYVKFTSHSNFPFLTEMLYTIGLAFGSTALAKLFHFSMYIATTAGLYSLGRRHLSATAGKVAALLFMSVPVVLYEAGVAYADITMGFYVLLATYALLNWEERDSRGWLVICGLMSGLALGTKVLTAVPIFIMCLIVLIRCGRSCQWGRGLKLGWMVGLISILIGCVWYIKAYVYTGNPFYPFLYNIFGGRNWSAFAAHQYQIEQASFGKGKAFQDLLVLPWNLLVNGIYFSNAPNPQSPNIFTLIGPAFVGLIPAYILKGKLTRTIADISLIALAFVGAWFIMMQHSRYLITVIPLLCIVAAAAVDMANREWRTCRFVVNGFVALCVTLSLLSGGAMSAMCGRAAFGLEPRDDYISRTLDVYDAESYINDQLPAKAKIVLFDEVRGFYLDRDYIWGNPGHHELIPWSTFKTGTDMVTWFKKEGFTHALVNWKFAGKNDDLHGKLIPDAVAHGIMQEVHSSHGVSVYELK